MLRKRLRSAPGFILFLGWLLASPSSWAQTINTPPGSDTLRLSVAQVEQLFLDRNFQLLAQQYQIDIAGAGVTQAKLHANPNVLFMTNLYNPNTNQVLPLRTPSQVDLANQVYNSGYVQLQVQQLIQLAGKRSKLIALAESNRSLAQLAFRDLLRTLRYQLHSTYANLYFDLKALTLFGNELTRQQRLADSYRVALKSGGIAPFEVTRLDLANRDLQANIAHYQSQIADEQAALRVLLRQGDTPFVYPIGIPAIRPVLPPAATALDSALAHRPDMALTQEQITNAQRSLSLERARRTPNLTVGVDYERYGNAYLNFMGLQLLMDLPIRNRNQGAVQAAELTLKSVGAGLDNQQNLVKSEVLNAYDKLKAYYTLFNSRPPDLLNHSQIQQIATDATRLYNARTISLLDYLDKIRVYQQAQLNDINLDNNLYQSQQLFNYVTNTRFF
jgi:cobalt-zinc-cadmium efflux system outer membrane protein